MPIAIGPNVIRDSGIVPAHIQPMGEVARRLQLFIMVRAVNNWATGLIAASYATKGLHVKGKSSDWGPQAGFIAVDQSLSKLGPKATAATVSEFNGKVQDSLSHGFAVEVPLVIPESRVEELAAGGAMMVTGRDAGGTRRATATKGPGLSFELRFVPPTVEPVRGLAQKIEALRAGGYAVYVQRPGEAPRALTVLADQATGLPLTADYDLYAVAPRLHRAGSGLVLNARTVIGKSYHDDMGKYTGPESEVVKAINLAAASVGYRGNAVCHHGPEVNNPFPEQDWPITVFSPTGRVFGVSDQNTLEEVAAEIQILDFHFHTNPKYDPLVRRAVERKLRTVQTKMQAGRAAGNVGSVLWNAAQMKKTQDFLSLDPKKHMLFADRRAGGVIVHLQEEQRALG